MIWSPAARISCGAHVALLLLLVYRPLGAGFVKPSDIRFGHGDVVTELIYAPPLELHEQALPSPLKIRRSIPRKTANPRVDHPVADPATDPLLAGSQQGSLPDGPVVGFVRQPALPVVGPDVPRSSLPPGLQGDVIVEITIDTQGNVAETRILQSLGPEVDGKVVATLHTWHFRPATTDGVANVSKQDVHFHFPS
jgi:TonB family protein